MRFTVQLRTRILISGCIILNFIFLPFIAPAQPGNDACGSATVLVSSYTAANTTGTLKDNTTNVGATATPGIAAFCGNAASPDVWYSFVAQSTMPTINLNTMGTNMDNAPRLQLFNTTSCTVATLNANSNNCVSGTNVTTLSMTPATALTIGTTYLIRVFSNGNNVTATPSSTWNFNINVVDPAPANDACAAAVSLTSGITCANTAGTLYSATATASISAFCGNTTSPDVWYSFVAQTTSPTISLSSMGSNLDNTPRLQLFNTNSCTIGTINANSNNCVSGTNVTTLSLTPLTALTVGNTYLVRVFTTTAMTNTGSTWNFNICVTDPAPANDGCAAAVTLTSAPTCNTVAGTLYASTATASISAFCGNTTSPDVWYSFVAKTTSPTISLSNMGSNMDNTPRLQLFNTSSCTIGTLNSNSNNCVSGASTTTLDLTPATALTIGNTYLVRVFTTTAMTGLRSTWNFDICVTDPPPSYDVCATPVILAPGTTCSGTAGSLYAATATASISAFCASSTSPDVWYSFVATSTSPIVTLSGMGSDMDNAPRLQLFNTNSCTVATLNANSNNCVSGTNVTTLSLNTASSLTIGATYLVRVFTNSPTTGTPATWAYTICVTNPPANDDCSGALSLTPASTCGNIGGTLLFANPTSGLPGSCGNATAADVWYSFTAQTSYPTIALSSVGATFSSASPRIQILEGTCGSLNSIACGTTTSLNTATNPGGAGLTIGNVYFVRISSNSATIPVSGTWTFNICITDPVAGRVDYSKSYVNISKGLNGGTVDPGDTLEIRATLAILSKGADSLAFFDTLYHNQGFKFVPGSITLRTNEGKIYGTPFSDGYDSDAGWRLQNGSDTVIQINIGVNANNVARGKLRNTSKPSFYNSSCIIMATYRVVVYAGYNTKINYRGGAITYRDTATGVYNKINFPSDSLIVYLSPGLCPNATSTTNAVGVESNGTFGAPSTGAPLARNRGTSAYSPAYTYAYFQSAAPQGPQDYYYGITNNTSARYTLLNNWGKADGSSPSYRVFTLWDIIGDHTGAANTSQGNAPCDTTKPVSPTNPCGYMLVINSSYKTDTAFQYTVSNLCPNTYYEISAWIRNICYKCGCDSNGVGASGGGYIPLAAGDSSGVQPNLAYQVDGIDYYTTGNIRYTGTTPTGSDATNSWIKKGFTYLTGSNQTSFRLTLRNNAPGGGGNDWALDDITVATCLPNMSYSPSLSPTICDSNTLTIYDTVRSYFNTYNYYKWQRSTNGGSNWADLTAATGPVATTYNGSSYQYVSSYTIPPSQTTLADSGNLYRVIVATTTPNLANTDCQFTDGISIITLDVMNCYIPLKIDLLTFNGKLANDHSHLNWSTTEDEPVQFEIERSLDGINFTKIGSVMGTKQPGINQYSFVDPGTFETKAWYRIGMINQKNKKKYSRIIKLTKEQIDFAIGNIINPFSSELAFEVVISNAAKLEISLTDMYGKVYKTRYLSAYSGVNSISLKNMNALPAGMYILSVKNKNAQINNMVLKK